MLTLKVLWGFTKNTQNNHILPELMMWLYRQIVVYSNLIMMIDETVKYKQRRYGVSREAVRLSALSSNKINQSEHLTGKDILPSGPSQII